MRLYSGMSQDFIRDTVHNQIADRLADAFFRQYRYRPSPSEVGSWRNSLRAFSQVIDRAKLHDHGVLLEYQLPLTSRRLDCLLTGQDESGRSSAAICELKQWERCEASDGEHLVSTRFRGADCDVLHPSAQVGQYQRYLADTHTAFYEAPDPIRLGACAYLHNYSPVDNDPLLSERYAALLREWPSFTGDDVEPLTDFLVERVGRGCGGPILRRIEQSRYRPSKKLMDHVAGVIDGLPQYVLLDEQLVVFDRVRALARRGFEDRRKIVVIVRGGPGTGKSVIAINLMADLLRQGLNAHYATGSRAFTETLRDVIGSRGAAQFKYFNSYRGAQINDVDVLICDEAHRIRETSHDRFTPAAARTNKPQILELIDASKVSVFLVDDRQGVRPAEIGSSEHIRRHAAEQSCQVLEFQLEAQFRCAGSEGFVSWIDNTLGIERTAHVMLDPDLDFDFRIMRSVEELDSAIRLRTKEGHSARLVAGFCWPWSDPTSDGRLVDDVVIDEFRRPWNAKPEARKLAQGIPKATLWAHDPKGIDQVGCIYTAQGFEFDYVGVILGTDLTYDFNTQSWIGHPKRSYDRIVRGAKGRFVDLVKNTYRVLLSRGLKGCYVLFLDKQTEHFFKSRMESSADIPAREVAEPGKWPKDTDTRPVEE